MAPNWPLARSVLCRRRGPRDTELSRRLLVEAREELLRADTKASLLLATAMIVAAAVLAAMLAGDWRPSSLTPWAQLIWWAAFAVGTGGLVALGIAVYPRTRRTRGAVDIITFFGDIAETDVDQASDKIARSARSDAPVIIQLVQVAAIVRVKYRWIRAGMWSFATALFMCVGAMVASRMLVP